MNEYDYKDDPPKYQDVYDEKKHHIITFILIIDFLNQLRLPVVE
jgi:hypothetical protein